MAPRIQLYDVETGRGLGEIDRTQLARLAELLEEESEEDRDYWIDEATLELLAEQSVDATLVARLREALGTRDGFDVGWREIP
jgi:hypothetical protein